MTDKTIRELQTSLPWTIRYSQDYRANPQPHKDFTHALLHVVKAVGKLQGLSDDMDHDRQVADDSMLRSEYGKYVADLVICALRAANVFPGGVLDLQAAVQDRIEVKNTNIDIVNKLKPVWFPVDIDTAKDQLKSIKREPIKDDRQMYEAFAADGKSLGTFCCLPLNATFYATELYGNKVNAIKLVHKVKPEPTIYDAFDINNKFLGQLLSTEADCWRDAMDKYPETNTVHKEEKWR